VPLLATVYLTPSSATTLQNSDGTISINFPQGAAVTSVQIALQNYLIDQIPPLPSGITTASTCFQVNGLTGLLAKNATVTVKYSLADLDKAGSNASKLQLARWDDGVSQWTILKTTVNTTANTLTATSNQMSIWAVVVGQATSSGISLTIIGIIIAVIVVVIAVVSFFLFRRRVQRKPAK
jgi:hypothetical protein